MVILPIGTERGVSYLPYGTTALVVGLILVFLLTFSSMADQEEAASDALSASIDYYSGHVWLTLPEELLAVTPPMLRKIYETNQALVREYEADPEAALHFVRSKDRRGYVAAAEAMQSAQYGTAESLTDPALYRQVVFTGLVDRTPAEVAEEQAQLDAMTAAALWAIDKWIARKYGYTPGKPSAVGLLAHMFLHGGWLHLIFNLIFLWPVAVSLEDYWGTGMLAAAYLLTGLAGALAHGAAHPDAMVPMIGASGAVAGLMGAFLIRFARMKIRFFYLYMLISMPRWGTFKAPAWVMIPLWFVGELFYALFADSGGVAYWAHVGGFVSGLGLATALGLGRYEERVLGFVPMVDEEGMGEAREFLDTLPMPEYSRAPDKPAGRPDRAAPPPLAPVAFLAPPPPVFEEVPRRGPGSIDAGENDPEQGDGLELAPPALDARPIALVAPRPLARPAQKRSPEHLREALRAALTEGREGQALAAYIRMRGAGVTPDLSPLLELHLGRILDHGGHFEDATQACRRAVDGEPDGPHAARGVYLAARILAHRLKRVEDGLSLLRQVPKLYPSDPFAARAIKLAEAIERQHGLGS